MLKRGALGRHRHQRIAETDGGLFRSSNRDVRLDNVLMEGFDILLRLKNKAETGLGKPLPAGTVSVMEPARRGLVFAGQDAIRDTAVGLPIEIQTGHALDVAITHRVTLTDIPDSGAGKHTRATVEATVENDKPVTVSSSCSNTCMQTVRASPRNRANTR